MTQRTKVDEARIVLPIPDGEDVGRLRKVMGITQAALAEELGVTRASVNRWEAGEQEPKSEAVVKAIDYLTDEMLEYTFELDSTLRKVGGLSSKYGKQDPEKRKQLALIDQHLRDRAYLVAVLAWAGGNVEMPLMYWQDLLNVDTPLFEGLPPASTFEGEPSFVGYDVGVALDAAIRCRPYAALTEHLGGLRSSLYAEWGEFRLVQEVNVVVKEIQMQTSNLPATKDEWLHYEPYLIDLDE